MVFFARSRSSRGELEILKKLALSAVVEVETSAGKFPVEWDTTAAVTPIGQLALFLFNALIHAPINSSLGSKQLRLR
jgi:hypothetical protein